MLKINKMCKGKARKNSFNYVPIITFTKFMPNDWGHGKPAFDKNVINYKYNLTFLERS